MVYILQYEVRLYTIDIEDKSNVMVQILQYEVRLYTIDIEELV